MLAKVTSCALIGLEGVIVEVEVDISPGLPAFTIVGLPDAAVQEARERVRSAIRNSGFTFPARRITVNLAPADLKKAGPAYDLPIAIGILLSSEQLSAEVGHSLLLGELSLDGGLRHTHGILPMVSAAQHNGFDRVIVPQADATEASLVEGMEIIPSTSLSHLYNYLCGQIPAPDYEPYDFEREDCGLRPVTDLAEIKGQEHVKRALEVAAAGGHNMVMCGPPGIAARRCWHARCLPFCRR
jgi:magnesium chelatase family protein